MDVIYKEHELDEVVKKLWNNFQSHKTWAFYAEMGAGKTTLIHHLCVYLGVHDHVSSPTFAIVNEYKTSKAGTVYHMDWYRLKNAAEAIDAGIEDLAGDENYCFIEWPEKAPELLPVDTIEIHIEIVDPQTRKLYATANSLSKKQ
jgi:tRNA threonylcarbamoyladenosine biosynthesis protein TsaE